jgi:hypothetical protein
LRRRAMASLRETKTNDHEKNNPSFIIPPVLIRPERHSEAA